MSPHRTEPDDNRQALSRRRFLQIGTFGGVSLPLLGFPQVARAITSQKAAHIKSCIVIFYYGGPSHLDTYDMKPDAPFEFRGDFRPIRTSASGLQICEHLPLMAKVMNKVALIRSMHHSLRSHDGASANALTGRVSVTGDLSNRKERPDAFPSIGASLKYKWGHNSSVVSHAALPFVMKNNVQNPGQTPGFLGPGYAPFLISGEPDTFSYGAQTLNLTDGLTLEKLQGRLGLLRKLEQRMKHANASSSMAMFHEQAYELLDSPVFRKALDIEQEPAHVRERYGFRPQNVDLTTRGGAASAFGRNLRGQNLLLARRLVEAGVSYVNVYDYKQQGQNWDTHSNNFNLLKNHLLPLADQGLSALIEDLDARGLLDTTLIVGLGEFGRSPKINEDGGRDHWPDCYTVLLAGGGIKGGFVHGASDTIGAYPAENPVTPGDLAATIFSRFGLDPGSEIHDHMGRPWKLAEGHPIHDLIA